MKTFPQQKFLAQITSRMIIAFDISQESILNLISMLDNFLREKVTRANSNSEEKEKKKKNVRNINGFHTSTSNCSMETEANGMDRWQWTKNFFDSILNKILSKLKHFLKIW